jgi:hypothetical protein
LAHWRQWQQEVLANNSLPGFQRVGQIRQTRAAGYPAADIEFTWNGLGGAHSLDRGIRANGRVYAVLVTVPASGWKQYQRTVNTVINSFQPVGTE